MTPLMTMKMTMILMMTMTMTMMTIQEQCMQRQRQRRSSWAIRRRASTENIIFFKKNVVVKWCKYSKKPNTRVQWYFLYLRCVQIDKHALTNARDIILNLRRRRNNSYVNMKIKEWKFISENNTTHIELSISLIIKPGEARPKRLKAKRKNIYMFCKERHKFRFF